MTTARTPVPHQSQRERDAAALRPVWAFLAVLVVAGLGSLLLGLLFS